MHKLNSNKNESCNKSTHQILYFKSDSINHEEIRDFVLKKVPYIREIFFQVNNLWLK